MNFYSKKKMANEKRKIKKQYYNTFIIRSFIVLSLN